MKTRRRTNFGSLESSCLLTKSGQLIPTLLFGASLFLAWLPSQINWFPVANLECSLCAMFFFFFSPSFPPLPNTQIQSFFPQRNKSKAALPSFYAAVCVHLFLYLSMVYFCFSSINAQACLLLHQASGRQLRSFPRFDRQVAGRLSPSLVFLFDLDLWDAEVCVLFFFCGPYHRNNGWVKTD